MIRNGLLLASALLVSSFAFAAPDSGIARIFCEIQPKNSASFWMMRSDVSNRYKAPEISFKDTDGATIKIVTNPIHIQSDRMSAAIYFVGTTAGANTLYKANIDIAYRVGRSEALMNLAPTPSTIIDAFGVWEMPRTQVAFANGQFALSRAAGSFEVVDANTLKTVKSWKIDGNQVLNPEFSADGKWVKLEIFDNKNIYSTKIFSLTSDEVLSLPASGRQTQVGLSFVGNAVAWTESNTFAASSDKTLVLKTADFAELRKGKSRTILTETSKFLRALRVFQGNDGRYFTVVLKETYSSPVNSPEKSLTKGEAVIVSLGNDLSVTSSEAVNFDPTFYYLGKSMALTPYGVLSNMTYSPYSNQVIFSLGHLGGLASLNLETKQWAFHAVNSLNTCYYPVVGPEVTND